MTIKRFVVFLSICASMTIPIPALSAGVVVDFDQGMHVSDFIKEANRQALENQSVPEISAKPATQRVCKVSVYQRVASVKLVQIENMTSWLVWSDYPTPGTTSMYVSVLAQVASFDNSWKVISGPFSRDKWITPNVHNQTLAQAGFKCDGSVVCPGGPYYLTLFGYADVFVNGDCEGSAEYAGQVLPGADIYYTVEQPYKQWGRFSGAI